MQNLKATRWRVNSVLVLIAAIIAAPIIATVWGAFGESEAAAHLWSTNGFVYARTTVLLCVCVAVITGLFGAGLALLLSLAEFPGRRVMDVLLVLPFAIPAYVAAYAYGDFLGPFGPVASMIGAGAVPEIRSFWGAVFVMSLATYPYVFLAMRAGLAARSGALMEAARLLGANPWRAAMNLLAPLSRPALMGGLALALMETAAEFGVADYFGVKTLSVGIFRTWYGLGDLTAATQLASSLFLLMIILIVMEAAARTGDTADTVRSDRTATRLTLSTKAAGLALLVCLVPVLFGFMIPTGVFLTKLDVTANLPRGFLSALGNTLFVAGLGALLAGFAAIILAYGARTATSSIVRALVRIATLGYAIPGAVIAIGLLSLTTGFSKLTGIALMGTAATGIGVLVFAYVSRFLTASYNATEGGLAQIGTRVDEAAHVLGARTSRVITTIHLPLARRAIAAGLAIVAIDIAKELPATLILRPFNFETLSTHIYRLASDERLADAAPSALILIAVSLAPVLLLSSQLNNKAARDKTDGLEAQT